MCGVCGNVESDYAQRCVCGVCGNVERDYAQRCVCVAFVVMWRVITHRGVCGVCGNVESGYAQRCVCGVCGNVESDYAQRCVCGTEVCVCVAFVEMWRLVPHRDVCVWRLW